MRALHYTGVDGVRVVDVEGRPPGRGEVTVEVAYAGICGTDLHVVHGAMEGRVTTPAVLGHEMSGRISALGAGVVGLSVGDPVTVMPLRWCGECPACHRGYSHVCQRLDFVGIDSPGALQERWNVPAEILVPLPAGLSLRRAALVEPTAVAVHDVRRAAVLPGEYAVVVGAGPVGLLVALVARDAGARVLVAETDAVRREHARAFGLEVVVRAGGRRAGGVARRERRGPGGPLRHPGRAAGVRSRGVRPPRGRRRAQGAGAVRFR